MERDPKGLRDLFPFTDTLYLFEHHGDRPEAVAVRSSGKADEVAPDDAMTFTNYPSRPLSMDELHATRVLFERACEVERIAAPPHLRRVARAPLAHTTPLAADEVTVFDGRPVVVSKCAEGTTLECRLNLASHLGAHVLTPAEWEMVQHAVAAATKET